MSPETQALIQGNFNKTAASANWTYNKDLSTGDVVHRSFRRTGTFKFRCVFHSTLVDGHCSGMCGKVVVTS